MTFNHSEKNTLGVELELLLVDRKTLLPTNRSHHIFQNISDEFRQFIHPEFFQNMLEISSPIFHHADDIEPFFIKILNHINHIGEQYDIVPIAMGTHPLLYQQNAIITKKDRYNRLHHELQAVLNRFLILGLHIHVGIQSSAHAINACNMANYYLPIFLALSTSSPFFEGENTGLHSYRSKIFESLPRGGIPEFINSYEEFSKLVSLLNHHGAVQTFNEIWWDVRIRPDFGTLELRVCDSINDLKRIQSIATLFQALCLYASHHPQPYFFHQISKQNKWCAVRHSMDGKFIDGQNVTTIKEKSLSLVNTFESENCFTKLQTRHYLPLIRKYINKTPLSQNMIEQYESTGNYRNVIKQGVIQPL